MAKTSANTIVPPFGIEIDAPRNNDVLIQSIVGCRLRSAHKARAGVQTMPMVPNIPGMQLHVNPEMCEYSIIDPLHEDTNLCDQIEAVLKQSSQLALQKKLRGVPPRSGTLDVDRMKTLCREILCLVDSDFAVVVKGPKPSIEDVEDLPGDFLLNPGSRVHNSQPRYEKDLDAYERQLSQVGG